MRKIYLELTEDQKRRGIVFSSSLSKDRQEGKVIKEVFGDDPIRTYKIDLLLSNGFFSKPPFDFRYNIIRQADVEEEQ